MGQQQRPRRALPLERPHALGRALQASKSLLGDQGGEFVWLTESAQGAAARDEVPLVVGDAASQAAVVDAGTAP